MILTNKKGKTKTSKLINKTIKESDLPDGIKIGLLKRDNEIQVPDKDTIIKENDEVIILCMSDSIHDAEELFQVRGAFWNVSICICKWKLSRFQ